jgi:hypothetical protein
VELAGISGGQIAYEWAAGSTIEAGQGTAKVTVATASYGGNSIDVSVSVNGVDGCQTLADTASIAIEPKEAIKLGQYTGSTLEMRPALLSVAEKDLLTSNDLRLFLVAHEQQTVARLTSVRHHKPAVLDIGEARRMAEADKQSLVQAGIPADRITILTGAPENELTVEFYLVPRGAILPLSNVAVGAASRPRVEVMWTLLDPASVGDNFGGNVKRKYYCVEVTIRNNSGYEFQVGGFGFTAPGLAYGGAAPASVPSTNYQMVRNTINQGQRSGFRGSSLAVIKGLGLVMTGVTPFFRSINPQRNFSNLTNLLRNPVEVGFEMIFPDQTIRYLEQLDNVAFRASSNTRLSIPNSSGTSTIIFLPKGSLNLPKPERDRPQAIIKALGDVFVFGDTIQRVNSIRVYGRP